MGSRILLAVRPLVNVHDQLVTTRLGSSVTLRCNVEASPQSVHYWVKQGNGPNQQGEHALALQIFLTSLHLPSRPTFKY